MTVGKDELFRLDAALVARLRADGGLAANPKDRADRLVELLFGPDGRGFAYATGHSTVAAQTWRDRRGDCLSLTVLAYALARTLGAAVQMQEVRVPTVIDRRDGIDYLSRHVNVLVRLETPATAVRAQPARSMLIDFEPAPGSFREGTPLGDDGILARYYNNVAVAHYTRGEDAPAYAHFKAAILADPRFAASYGNLAQLYLRRGYAREAEQLLRHAVGLTDEADLALRSLHELLVAQGRTEEAARFEALLRARRERDPYYWLGVGVERLRAQDARTAIAALEKARAMTHGFDEVHRYLALAYWHAGDARRAQDQLALLAASEFDDRALAVLRSKIGGSPPADR